MPTAKHFPIDDYPYLVYTSSPDGIPTLVTGVTVAPLTASVAQGATQTFTAQVVGSGEYDESVTWSVEVESGGTLQTNTKITSAGVLTVASNQATTKKLYVKATTANGIESVAAVVTVTS